MNMRLNMLLVPVLTLLLQGCLSAGGGGSAEIVPLKPPTSGTDDNGSTEPNVPGTSLNGSVFDENFHAYTRPFGSNYYLHISTLNPTIIGYANEETVLVMRTGTTVFNAQTDSIETASGRVCHIVGTIPAYGDPGSVELLCKFDKLPVHPVFGPNGIHEFTETSETLYYKRNGVQALQRNLGQIYFINRGKLQLEVVNSNVTDLWINTSGPTEGKVCEGIIPDCGKEIKVTNISGFASSGFRAAGIRGLGTCATQGFEKSGSATHLNAMESFEGSSTLADMEVYVELEPGQSCTFIARGSYKTENIPATFVQLLMVDRVSFQSPELTVLHSADYSVTAAANIGMWKPFLYSTKE
ncbi:hypothetical protein [Bdellovibrio bacteriovorus]|uniref:Lipoprotein n=1 Tax=Bdellovibrio bacteriovorus str. Tiberius TaxID=1069642 RepID=K7YW23_BDEBC|nr:hypothetical protein [Bdellovibrio bacteriovorus]AFY00890.1 Hypothetical protein Bdt_1191 [Bdellovibrio bacteriovorus str. Tiberius]